MLARGRDARGAALPGEPSADLTAAAEATKVAVVTVKKWRGGRTPFTMAIIPGPAMRAMRLVASKRPLVAWRSSGSGASTGTVACKAGSKHDQSAETSAAIT